jgi:hypothetical protein
MLLQESWSWTLGAVREVRVVARHQTKGNCILRKTLKAPSMYSLQND